MEVPVNFGGFAIPFHRSSCGGIQKEDKYSYNTCKFESR
jgi:hypothetical protein